MKNLLGGGGCKIIQPNSSLAGLFEEKMNLIIANQSLYYLPKSVLAQNVAELYKMCEKGAIFFATMMSEKNYYFKHAGNEDSQGLREVVLKGRLNETSYIHFVKDAQDLKALFAPFKCLYLGEYDPINFYEFEGSAHHFIFVGVKE